MDELRDRHRLQGGNIQNFRKQAEQALKPRVGFTATPVQEKWIAAITSGKYRFLGIGGGIRGTKTFACLAAVIVLCKLFPRSRWAIVRKDLPTLRRNVVPSMEKLRLMGVGGFVGELNMSSWVYTCKNGSEILLFPEQITQDPELERWKGLEVNGFVLEESSELSEVAANKAIERAGSWIIPSTPDNHRPNQPPPLVMCSFNPCNNWPRRWFYDPWKSNSLAEPYFFQPATIADNPYATEEYKESLKYLPPEEYKRFVMGEWEFIDDPRQLIKTEWVWDALNVEPVHGPARLGVDVARYGDDKTKIAKVLGNHLRKIITAEKTDVPTVTNLVLNEANDHDFPVEGKYVNIDGIGVGGGVVDNCRKAKLKVREFIAGAKEYIRRAPGTGKPLSVLHFKDLRSQAWWEFREKLRLGQVCLQMVDRKGQPITMPPKLIGDLTAPRYEISGEKVVTVESKEDLKEPDRLGRSTDDGDAVVTAFFEMPPEPVHAILPGTVVLSRGH